MGPTQDFLSYIMLVNYIKNYLKYICDRFPPNKLANMVCKGCYIRNAGRSGMPPCYDVTLGTHGETGSGAFPVVVSSD